MIACEGEGITIGERETLDVYVLNLSAETALYAFTATTMLRAAGYKTDCDYQNRSFKAQFKSVERKGAKVVLIIGQTEMENGQVSMKRLRDQRQEVVALDALIDTMDDMFAEHEDDHHHSEEKRSI